MYYLMHDKVYYMIRFVKQIGLKTAVGCDIFNYNELA